MSEPGYREALRVLSDDAGVDLDAEGGHEVQQGGAVLDDLSREEPERAGVLSVAVRSCHPVRQLGACRRPREMIIEVDAEHAGLGLPGITGDVRPSNDSSSLAVDLAGLRVPDGLAPVSPGRRMPSP